MITISFRYSRDSFVLTPVLLNDGKGCFVTVCHFKGAINVCIVHVHVCLI